MSTLKNLNIKHKIAFFLAFALALCPVHLGLYFYIRQPEIFQMLSLNPNVPNMIGLSLTPWAFVCQGIINLVLLPSLSLERNPKVFIFQSAMTIFIAVADSIPGIIYYLRFPVIGPYPHLLPVLVTFTSTLITVLMWDYIFPKKHSTSRSVT